MLPRPAWLALGVVAAAGASLASPVAAAGTAVGAVMAACMFEALGRRAWAPSLAVVAVGAAAVVLRLTLGTMLAGGGPAGPVPLPAGSGTWQATVTSAHTKNGQQIATIQTAEPTLLCAAQFPALPRLTAGDTVSWTGWFAPLADSDYDRWLASSGVDATCQARDMTLVRHDDSAAGRIEGFRQASGDALQRVLPEPGGGLLAAILIGLRDRVDRDVAAAFTTAGVSHIVAISGWNIAIVAATIAALLRGLVSRRRRALITILAILAYTVFAGASPSVVRAAAMSGVALLAQESGRGSRVIVGLAWAVAIMLLVEPAIVGDVGFQLSATATAGLLVWATPLTKRLGEHAPWLPSAIRESLGISLAAQAATLPIVLLAFGRLAVIAPLANLVAVPLVPPAMAAGAVAFLAGWMAVLGLPGWLAGMIAMPAWALLAALIWVVQLAAAIPGANETLPFPANAVAAAAATALIWRLHRFLSAPPRRKTESPARPSERPAKGRSKPKSWHRPALLGAAFIVALAGCVIVKQPDGRVHIVVLDVGQGDAILVEGDHGGRILIDGGPDGAALLNALDRYVPAWDRHLQAVVLTHPHDDHVAGLALIVQRYRVDRAFESGWAVKTPAYRAWLDALASRHMTAERLRTGDQITLDDVTLRVLWPDDGTVRPSNLDPSAADNRKANDSSIVLLGEYENRRFLLTGDTEEDVDPVLLERGLPTVDVLKVAHHGSATASTDELLASLRPTVALISVGAKNTYGHPAPSTLGRLRTHARTILRTDLSGSVEATLDRSGVTVSPSRPAGSAVLPISNTGRLGLLYDSVDVRPEPSRQRGPAPLAAAAVLAPPAFQSGRRNGRLAGVAHRVGWAIARSPPGRIGRAPT